MNKYAITSILLGTIAIGSILALLPVEEASTVHTTILANTEQIRTITTVAAGVSIADNDEIKVECGGVPFILRALYISENATSAGTDDDIDIDAMELEGAGPTAGDDLALGDDGAFTATSTAVNDNAVTAEYVAELVASDPEFEGGVISRGEALDLIVLGTLIDAGARFDIDAVVVTTNQAACTVTATDGVT